MIKNPSHLSCAARIVRFGMAVTALCLTTARGQNPAAGASEQTAPAIPVDIAALTVESAPAAGGSEKPAAGAAGHEKTSAEAAKVTDYTTQIGNGLKERERRLTLLNEAMMKLREAGEMEDAGRVEERIRALLEMPAPSQANSRMRAEIDQLRTKNDELNIQLVATQEELKRYRPNTPGSSRKGMASADR